MLTDCTSSCLCRLGLRLLAYGTYGTPGLRYTCFRVLSGCRSWIESEAFKAKSKGPCDHVEGANTVFVPVSREENNIPRGTRSTSNIYFA